eukprot:264501_1
MEYIKMVMVGDVSVGKTCLGISYTTNAYPSEYIPTVFDNYSKNVMVDGKPIHLDLWDTRSTGDFDRLRPLEHPDTDVFVICYAVNDIDSFNHIESKWLPEIKKYHDGVPWIVFGCKTDLGPYYQTQEEFILKYGTYEASNENRIPRHTTVISKWSRKAKTDIPSELTALIMQYSEYNDKQYVRRYYAEEKVREWGGNRGYCHCEVSALLGDFCGAFIDATRMGMYNSPRSRYFKPKKSKKRCILM